MEIKIDTTIPDLTEDEIAELKNAPIRDTDDHPEQFKKDMLGVKTFVMSPQVEAQLKEMGLTPDDIVAMMLKKAGAAQ